MFKVFYLYDSFLLPYVSLILLLTSNGQVLFFYMFPLTNATFYSYNCNLDQNSIEYHYDQTKRCTVLFKVKPHCGEAIHSNEQSCRHCALKWERGMTTVTLYVGDGWALFEYRSWQDIPTRQPAAARGEIFRDLTKCSSSIVLLARR